MLISFLSLLGSALALYGAIPSAAFTGSPSTGNIVDVGYARYLGNRSYSNTVAYLGVPYAEPPLGDRRFRAPMPLNTTRISQQADGKVINAMKYPDFCVQGSLGEGDAGGAGSEDCLNVNIYAPFGAGKDSNLPVLVYIHGGGYVYGNPRNWPFDHWIHQSPNVVIVSVYYRLDSFGFLTVAAFDDPTNGDFNVGLQDQTQALRWVQKNIHAFGGDPSRVTINGESAGGSSVELHLVSHTTEKLFSGAIAQSVDRTPVPTPAEQKPLFDFYASQAGCGSGPVPSQLACLRNASVGTLSRAQDASTSAQFRGSYNGFHPVVDGKIITDLPTRSIIAGNFVHVPLMVGATSNETTSTGGNITASLHTIFPKLNSTDLNDFLKEYPEHEFVSEDQRFQVATGESMLICARTALGEAFAKAVQTWTYRYNQPNPTNGSDSVGHAAENWMMFLGTNTGFNGSTTFTPLTPVETAFSEELIAYWLSFVRSGDPNTHKLVRSPQWPPYLTNSKSRIVLQQDPQNTTTYSGSYSEMEPKEETRRCQFVVSKVAHEQN